MGWVGASVLLSLDLKPVGAEPLHPEWFELIPTLYQSCPQLKQECLKEQICHWLKHLTGGDKYD